MKLANKITLSRFVLAGVGLLLLYLPGYEAKLGALAFFLAAMFSDTLDGIIALRLRQRSFFGKIFDQTADKVLVNMFWLAFLDLSLLPFWLVALNLFREIFVVSVRGVVGEKGVVLESKKTGKAEFAGRLKAGLQMFVILVGLVFVVIAFRPDTPIASYLSHRMLSTVLWLGVLAVAVSYWALLDFLWKYRAVITADA